MNISLTSELEQFIQSQVESGKYASADEVILAALRAFEERERIYKGRFEELRGEIAIAVEASERGEVVDGETIFSQLQQRKGWMPGFFEQTAGCLADDPIVIDDEGDFEERERLE